MAFGEKILGYKDDILNTLSKLVEIDSVSAEGNEKPQQALEFMLNTAKEMGLIAENFDNLAGHIQYGNGKKLCGVLTHLDVVPAVLGWSVEPFKLTRKDGRLYGRGVADDKGSAVVALYCLKALKDNGIIADSTVRLILGTNEETGMTDVEHYFSKMPVPDVSFTPDSDYGICNCEKGILQFSLTGKNNSSVIKSAKAGCAVNAVPDRAEFTLAEIRDEFAEDYLNIEGNILISTGTASHAMEPHKGFNSVTNTIEKLKAVYTKDLGDVPEFISEYIGTDTDGSLLGVNCDDKQSGDLTINVGVLDINEQTATVKIDIRYPVTADFNKIVDKIEKSADKYNLQFKVDSHLPPLNVPENTSIISTLQTAYKEITGEMPNLYSTGGGTYARSLGNKGVAFGPVFPDDY